MKFDRIILNCAKFKAGGRTLIGTFIIFKIFVFVLYLFWWGGHCGPMHCDLLKAVVLPEFRC